MLYSTQRFDHRRGSLAAALAGLLVLVAAGSTAHAGFVPGPPSDLSVALSDSPDPATAGGTITYAGEIRNPGPSTASAVQARIQLTGDVELVSVAPSQGSCVRVDAKTFNCLIDDVDPGETASVVATAQPRSGGTVGASFNAPASYEDENKLDNNFASESTTVTGGAGGGACTIGGSADNDVVRGTSGSDVICTGAGNDVVHGLGGDDIVRAGAGNDVVRGGEGEDHLVGGAGHDVVRGQGGDDLLRTRDGVRGNDVARGDAGIDSCNTDPQDVTTSCP